MNTMKQLSSYFKVSLSLSHRDDNTRIAEEIEKEAAVGTSFIIIIVIIDIIIIIIIIIIYANYFVLKRIYIRFFSCKMPEYLNLN